MSSTTNESQTKHIKTVHLTLSKVAEITGIIIPECFDALKNRKNCGYFTVRVFRQK